MARNQHTFVTKFTQAQRDAVTRAVVVDGLGSKTVAKKAAAGELDGVGRFTMTPAYIRKLAAEARADISPAKLVQPGESERAIEQARARTLALVLRGIERWEHQAKTGKADWPEHARLMRALREHERQTGQGRQRAQTGQGDNPDDSTHTDASALLAGLLERARSNGDTPASNGESAASLPSAHDS